MIKPITDEQLSLLDQRAYPYASPDWWLVDALRERLRLAEMHAGSDREERQYWESRYVEVRDQLALAEITRERSLGDVRYLLAKLELADALVEVVECLNLIEYDDVDSDELLRLIAAYRAEVKP